MVHLDHIRSQSLFGLSRREVLLHLGHRLRGRAAGGHQSPAVRPAAAGRCRRSSRRGTRSARSSATASSARATRSTDLKTAQDWILERQFRQVPGRHRRRRLRRRDQGVPRRGRPLSAQGAEPDADAADRPRSATPTRTSAGSASRSASSRSTCAASASCESLRDIGNVVVAETKGMPVRVRDIARVLVGCGAAPRHRRQRPRSPTSCRASC